MGDRESNTKQAREESWVCRLCNNRRRGQFSRERQIAELISLGAPLPGILNKLCAAIDSQIGNVVSLVLMPDEQEYDAVSITQLAGQFGLKVFSSSSILSSDKSLLGMLQIYCCDDRHPDASEAELIARIVRLAAVAFQRHEDAGDPEKTYRRLRSESEGSIRKASLVN